MVATLNTTVIQNASSSTANLTLDTAGNVTGGANLVATGMPYGSSSFLRNRIINGNMVIDQRNSGAAVSLSAAGTFTVDRWRSGSNGTWTSAIFSAQQNKGSVTLPAGFTNYIGIQTTTADSTLTSGTAYEFTQPIEGFNVSDLAWGTANAKTVTLSFLVYSNLTGTFGGSICNSAVNRFYPFSFTISSANTWTTINVTIVGDTTGTWLTTNGVGLYVRYSLGAASNLLGAAGSWTGTTYVGVTGQQQISASTSNYIYITSVQLEQGSVATPFERPLYSKQLADCQRYLPVQQLLNGQQTQFLGMCTSTTTAYFNIPFSVTARVAPTGFVLTAGSLFPANASGASTANGTASFNTAQTTQGQIVINSASGLVAGNATFLYPNNNATLYWTGCEL